MLSRTLLAGMSSVLVSLALHAEEPAAHWAWKPPVRAAVPPGASHPIDAFLRAKIDAAGLKPAAPATREQLLRRATYDLTGLPPSPEELDAFLKDTRANAWEQAIDRLLASPRYGERWGRHWLDLARYADTNGYEFDEVRPDAWRYRDYVIRSFNDDKPYDRFILEQLAGDELNPDDRDALIATGFNLLGPDMTDSSDQVQRRHNTLVDMTDTASLVFLGLTLTCARCHDHKFEPLPISDYYRMQAFFVAAAFRKDVTVAGPEDQSKYESRMKDYLALTKTIRESIETLEGPHRKKLYNGKLAKLSAEARAAHLTPDEKRTGGQQELVADTLRRVAVTAKEIVAAMTAAEQTKLAALEKELKTFDSKKPAPLPTAMGMDDRPGPPVKTFILDRGELTNKGEEVEPGFPRVLTPDGKGEPARIEAVPGSSGRRLTLAKWIAKPENPLTGRVLVNRLWQHHFGRGLVPTPSDFGLKGEPPTHPELLDWLAREFADTGWSIKKMHRLMMTSAAYQQSTAASKEALAKDPQNVLLSHANRWRLEGEAVRDSLLAISGRLNSAIGGPGIVLPDNAKAAGGSRSLTATDDPKQHVRRSVYLFARRNLRNPFLEAFDLPDSNLSCPNREQSTTAPQALALLDSAEVAEASKALAERLKQETASETERIDRAFRLTLGRSPAATEAERAKAFLQTSPLSELCRALFNVNEFVYVD